MSSAACLAVSLWKPLELPAFQSYVLLFCSLTLALELYLNKKQSTLKSLHFHGFQSCVVPQTFKTGVLQRSPTCQVRLMAVAVGTLLISSEFTASTELQQPASRCAFSVVLLWLHKLIRLYFSLLYNSILGACPVQNIIFNFPFSQP